MILLKKLLKGAFLNLRSSFIKYKDSINHSDDFIKKAPIGAFLNSFMFVLYKI
jgi:hypothetical protein